MSKGLKFLIACALVFVLGLVMAVGGYAAGGAEGFRKAGEEKGWFGERVVAAEETVSEYNYEFDSIKSTGYIDLVIVASKFYSEVQMDNELEDIDIKAGKVVVRTEKDKEGPLVSTEGNSLIIDGGDGKQYSKLYVPKVIVFCSDDELQKIKVSSEACDIDMLGVSFAQADIETNAGDLDCKDVMSGGIKVFNDAGDIDISGVLKGMTDIRTEAGDIEVNVFAGLDSYTMDLKTKAGDIEVDGRDLEDSGSYTQKGGDDTLKLLTNAGDIEVSSR